MRLALVACLLATVATAGPADAERCLTKAQGAKQLKAIEARNRARYLKELGKQGLKPIKLKARSEGAPTRESSKSRTKDGGDFNIDPFEQPKREVVEHDGTVVKGEVWFTTREHVCGSDLDEFQFATDKDGNVLRVYSDIERSDRPEPLVCGCEPPGGGCGVTGSRDVLYMFRLPKGSTYKGDTKVSYVADDAYLRYTNEGCAPRALPR